MYRLSIKEEHYEEKTVEEMEREWEEYEACGKQREWFENQFDQFMLYCFMDKGRCIEKDEAYIKCLKMHRPIQYQTDDFLKMLMEKKRMDVCCVYFTWYSRNIIEKPLRVYADSKIWKEFLKELLVGAWTKQDSSDEARKIRIQNYKMVMDWIRIIHLQEVTENTPLTIEEKEILMLNDREWISNCIKNGFLRREKIVKYVEYVAEKQGFRMAYRLSRCINEKKNSLPEKTDSEG